jgi:hypothetical protein
MPASVSAEAMPIPPEPGAGHDHAVRPMLGHGSSLALGAAWAMSSPGAGRILSPARAG